MPKNFESITICSEAMNIHTEKLLKDCAKLLNEFLISLRTNNIVMWKRIHSQQGRFSVQCTECQKARTQDPPFILFELRYAFGTVPGDYVLFQIPVFLNENELNGFVLLEYKKKGYKTKAELLDLLQNYILKSLRHFFAIQRTHGVISGVTIYAIN